MGEGTVRRDRSDLLRAKSWLNRTQTGQPGLARAWTSDPARGKLPRRLDQPLLYDLVGFELEMNVVSTVGDPIEDLGGIESGEFDFYASDVLRDDSVAHRDPCSLVGEQRSSADFL